MARKVSVVIAVLVLAAGTLFVASLQAHVATASEQDEPVLVAQGPGPGPGGPGGRMTEADRARMRDQMMDRMLEQAGLTDNEKAAAKKALAAKNQARQTLTDQLTVLGAVVDKADASQNELKDALKAAYAAIGQYRKAVAAADDALVAELSVKSQARCLALGILDNGLGGMGMGRPGMGGRRAGAPAGR